QCTDGVEIVAEAGSVLDKAQADEARPAVDACADIVHLDARSTAWDEARLDATIAQVHPRIDVGGILLGGDDDVVAGLPGKTFRDEAEALAGVLDKGDFRGVGIDQTREEPAHLLDAPEPVALVDDAVLRHVSGPLDERAA